MSCSVHNVRWPCNAPLNPSTDIVHVRVGFTMRNLDGRLQIVFADESGSWPEPVPRFANGARQIDSALC